MKPRISLLTLGVDDLQRSLQFYRDGLGLQTPGILGEGDPEGGVVFFDLQSGLKLGLWARQSIAKDAHVALAERSASEFTIAHNVASRTEVDDVMDQARGAGARILKEAADTFWGGYSGYFQDPDGHVWEVAWNPGWRLEE